MTFTKKPFVTYKFYNIEQWEQDKIKEIVQKNIDVKADSYLKSIYQNKPDTVVKIDYKLQKNKKNRYEASFRFFYDGKIFIYKNKTAFKYTTDLVNHAFDHFKRHISDLTSSNNKGNSVKRSKKEANISKI